MKLAFKKILANVLVLMVVMLPLRAMAMPIDMSSDHCMNGDMAAEMSDMNHADHQMPVTDDEQAQSCDCCKQCVSHCTACASMTAVTFDLRQLSDAKIHKTYTVTADLLFTHITSPPSRPPQILTI